jgi:hypothetical protein
VQGGIAIEKSFVWDVWDVAVGDAGAVVLPNIVSRVGYTTNREDISQYGKSALRIVK